MRFAMVIEAEKQKTDGVCPGSVSMLLCWIESPNR